MAIDFTLLSDGPSDRALIPIVRWAIARHVGGATPINDDYADLRRLLKPPKTLADRISKAIELPPCNIIVVHRDAERDDPNTRIQEIANAVPVGRMRGTQWVGVVPVRMTETWLLLDEMAIRKAAGNPNGSARLNLPQIRDIERVPNPKQRLEQILRTATELNGRRLRGFRVNQAKLQVASYIEGFDSLLCLSAFQRFDRDVSDVVNRVRGDD